MDKIQVDDRVKLDDPEGMGTEDWTTEDVDALVQNPVATVADVWTVPEFPPEVETGDLDYYDWLDQLGYGFLGECELMPGDVFVGVYFDALPEYGPESKWGPYYFEQRLLTKLSKGVDLSDCEHRLTWPIAGMSDPANSTGYGVSICRDCGLFQVAGRINGEKFDIKFRLATEHSVEAAGAWYRSLMQEID